MACYFSSTISFICGSMILLALVSEEAMGSSPGEFIGTRNTEFVLNGSLFFFNGFNSYWMMSVAADPNERYKISNVFRDARTAGLTVCRTWAFSDGGDLALQISPGVYSEKVFQGLDFVISEARNYGTRVVLSLVNNYDDYGGRPQYVKWARSSGQQISDDDGFYTNQVVKEYYKNHVKTVLTRLNTITGIVYKDDPVIMAWELINEQRCEVDYSGEIFNAWIQEMSTFLKSLDNKHLVEVGLEGFYGDSVPDRKQYNPSGYRFGTDFISNNLIKEIDFATIHVYPDIWLSGQSEDSRMKFLQQWTEIHWVDSRMTLKKPLLFAEFGKSKKDSGLTISIRDSFLNTVYTNIYSSARSGGTTGGGLVWQILAENMESYYDGYEVVLSQDASTTAVINEQSHLMTTLCHKANQSNGRKSGHGINNR